MKTFILLAASLASFSALAGSIVVCNQTNGANGPVLSDGYTVHMNSDMVGGWQMRITAKNDEGVVNALAQGNAIPLPPSEPGAPLGWNLNGGWQLSVASLRDGQQMGSLRQPNEQVVMMSCSVETIMN